MNDPSCVGGTADGLGAEEGDVGRPESARRIGVTDKGRDQLPARGSTKEPSVGDRRSEPQEDRFVDQRLEAVPGHDGDQQVDRVGAEID